MENKNNISQELLETIERYLNGSMPSEEHFSFEERLQHDKELKQQVDDVRLILSGIETSVLKDKLDGFHKDLSGDTRAVENDAKTKNFWSIKYAIAASLALLVGFGGWWMMNNKSDSEKLFVKYFKPDPGLPTTMSGDSNYVFYDAMVNYKQGDYNAAIEKWKKIAIEKPQNDSINYFLGVAHLANGSENKAVPYLTLVTETEKSVFRKDAFYYLALVYLKSDNVELTKKNLLLNDSNKANDLLKELN